MIETFRLLRNIGQFDSVDSGQQLPLGKFALMYAENGRGKTTLAAVLRSMGNGNPKPILERHRLGAAHPPHLIVGVGGEEAMFQDGVWQRRFEDVVVFDDEFIADNVCAGMKVEINQRYNLHELILGGQGVRLNRKVQKQVKRIEQHNRKIQQKSNAIPHTARHGLSIDDFCALQPREDIDKAIIRAERELNAARKADAIQRYPEFASITLPEFDLTAVESLLSTQLPDLEAAAATRVKEHLARIGERSENWVGEGMGRIRGEDCPFCGQHLRGSSLIAHYQAYFSEAYRELRTKIDDAIRSLNTAHSGDVIAEFERSITKSSDTQRYWSQFLEIREIVLDTADIGAKWKSAFEAVLGALLAKRSAPLEKLALTSEISAAVESYDECRSAILRLNKTRQAENNKVAAVKERARGANIGQLKAKLANMRAVGSRYSTDTAELCDAYLEEKQAKAETERRRAEARAELDAYRENVFPTYESAVNRYLQRFNAGFQLASVSSVNTRGGPNCSYTMLINDCEVPLSATQETDPCFKNTMSSGDRNTLALAFFFASLDSQPRLNQMTVVIDDPMTSLDEHRGLTTVQEIRRLSDRVGQVVILSHSKPFLCQLWESADTAERSAIKISRADQTSTLEHWDVKQDCITEHDRRHSLVSQYIEDSTGINEREVAAALRPILECFIRVACPQNFHPGDLLGPFINRCADREGTPGQILQPTEREELRFLLDYANLFHHDTNPAYQTATINDQELLHFATRTLAFARK